MENVSKLMGMLNETHSLSDNEKKAFAEIIGELVEKAGTEQALKKSEKRYRLITENMADIITTMDMDLNFTYVSPSIIKLRGFTVEEALEQKIDQIMTPESFQRLSKIFAEELCLEQTGAADPERARIVELEEYKKDGTTIWVENTASFIRDKDQNPIGILAISRDITDRRKTEQEKAHLLAKIQTTLDATADGILVVSCEGKILLYNKRFVKYWEIPEAILKTGNDDQALSYVLDQLEDPDGFSARVRQLYENPEEKSFDTIPLKDGRIFERYSRPHLLNGEIIGRVWSFRDVTSRVKAEHELQQSEEKYRQLIQHAPVGLYEIDFISNRITTVNDVVCQSTGYTRQELLEMNPADLLTPESAHRFNERLQKIGSGEKIPLNVEYQILKKDGTAIWAEMNVRLTFEGKAVKGATVVAWDISERKQAEMNLSAEKKQWKETFEAISDWVSIIDQDHTILRSNRASSRIVDLSPNQVLGRRCYEIIHGTNSPVPDCPGERAFKSNQRESMEFQHQDGRWYRVTVDPMGGNPDGKERFVHVVRDITEAKKKEQALVSARKFKAFRLLSGGIAHDFNNLLAIIMGNLSLLDLELTEPCQKDILEDIETACKQAKILTHQFHTLAEGRVKEKGFCDIASILQSAVDDVRRARQVTISMDIDSPKTTLEGNRTQLQTAFYNILLNAAEAISKNDGKLSIQVRPTSRLPGMGGTASGIQIVFTDTGKGIDPEVIANIFDPYYSSKEMSSQKGRGLGLAMAKAIISKHGGDITVKSDGINGTTVRVCLPVSN